MMSELPTVEVLASALVSATLELWPYAKKWWDANFNQMQKQVTILLVAMIFTLIGAAYSWYQNGWPNDWVDQIVTILMSFVINVVATQGVQRSVKYIPRRE